jgi:hypothetical protein
MSLQIKTLNRYRQIFPNDTLREISARTGIQITRVFRLFNGKTMKVGELEALEHVISDKLKESSALHRLNEVIDQAATLMTNEELTKIVEHIERKNASRLLSRTYIKANTTHIGIA